VPAAPVHDRILAEGGIPATPASWLRTSAEAILVARCIALAAPGARIGLVIPDGLVTGARSRSFRRAILDGHRILGVVQIPRRSFTATDALAFVMVIVKGGRTEGGVPLSAIGPDGRVGPTLRVDHASAIERMDHDHHYAARGGRSTLAGLGAEVTRGNLETVEARAAAFPVFHVDRFPGGEARRSHALPEGTVPEGPRVLATAMPGDILVARLHRSLHLKVCGIASGRAALTSAVLRIRVPPPHRDAVLSALLSPEGAGALAATARGTGARMLAKTDLMRMGLPMGA
jgi:type I restriction enzyme M protein